MKIFWGIMFGLAFLFTVMDIVALWATGKSQTIFAQIVDNAALAMYFIFTLVYLFEGGRRVNENS